MSRNRKILWGYFFVTGLLTAIVFLNPRVIIMGLLLGVVPGLIFYIAPSLFFYSLILTGLIFLLRPVGKLRWGLAPLILACVGFFIPYSANQATFDKVREFTKDDIDVTGPIELGGSIAFIRSSNSTRNDDRECDRLCLRLLYNGAVERVLVGGHVKRNEDDFVGSHSAENFPTTAYFIEARNSCPPGPKRPSAVNQRILLGDCLMSEEATIADAEIIYVTEPVTGPRTFALVASRKLDDAAVFAKRTRIIKKAEDRLQTLYQKTETTSEPLLYPLLLGGIGHGSGGGISSSNPQMTIGFLRDDVVQNDLRRIKFTDDRRIFGVFADPVKVPLDEAETEVRALILKALLSKEPEKQIGHDFFPHYLASFTGRNLDRTPGQDLTPTQEDIDLVVLALKDERITSTFTVLRDFNKKLEPIPDELIEAMANRLLNTPDQKDMVWTLSASIGALPEGRAAIISDQILAMFQHAELGPMAWPAVARLGDGDPDAAQRYVSAFWTWYRINKTNRAVTRQDLPRGPLIGLCLMKEKAYSVRDELLEILRHIDNERISDPIIKVLVNMGAVSDLKREYKGTDRWSQISTAIWKKKSNENNTPKFCGLS